MINKIQKIIAKHFYVKTTTIDATNITAFTEGKVVVSIEPIEPRKKVVKTYGKNEKGQTYIVSKETIDIDQVKVQYHYTTGITYNDLVAIIVRKFYSQDEEYAILRKALAHNNPAEYPTFKEYHATVETIKTECRKVFN